MSFAHEIGGILSLAFRRALPASRQIANWRPRGKLRVVPCAGAAGGDDFLRALARDVLKRPSPKRQA